MQKIISLKKNGRKRWDERRRREETRARKRRRGGRNDGAVVGWCCRCCSTGLIAFKRLWTRRSPPLNMCFSDFIRCYPSLRTLCVRACTLRENTSDAFLASNAPVCTVHNRVVLVPERRDGDRGISVLDRWIPTCLLTKEYPIIGKPFSRTPSHAPSRCVFHHNLFSSNGARWKIKIATNSPIPRLLRYIHRVCLRLPLHTTDRCVIMRSYLSGNKRSEMI